jgi:hypothetical protein
MRDRENISKALIIQEFDLFFSISAKIFTAEAVRAILERIDMLLYCPVF